MSLSLVPEYDSSSSSDSESEPVRKPEPKAPTPQPQQKQGGIQSLLSSILPPPKAGGEKGKIKILLDLPAPLIGTGAATASPKPTMASSSSTSSSMPAESSGGGMFAELSRILPPPKHAAASMTTGLSKNSTSNQVSKTAQTTNTQPRSLIPHSISKRQKSKPEKLTQTESTESKSAISSGPFFTIDATDEYVYDESLARETQDTEAPSQRNDGTEPDLHYDPTSGYYYDYVSGTYYHFDPETQSYIDARSLFDARDNVAGEDKNSGDNGDQSDSLSGISKADLQHMIGGRGGMRRDEIQAMLKAPVKQVTQSAQLQDSGYSDTKAAADFSTKQWSEQKRKQTQGTIDADNVDRKKKQKHNIMYLALQAQENEVALKEASASRQRSKKAARARYGM
ncbi:hypothetical protein GGI05_000300 [Coemansia sp. RSA 2603]|nr:hypothetical protein GGI05_000300 [Coemansia sp. RSA 2603]